MDSTAIAFRIFRCVSIAILFCVWNDGAFAGSAHRDVALYDEDVWISTMADAKPIMQTPKDWRRLTTDRRPKVEPKLSPDGKRVFVAYSDIADPTNATATEMAILTPSGDVQSKGYCKSGGLLSEVEWLTDQKGFVRFHIGPNGDELIAVKLPSLETIGNYFGTQFCWDSIQEHVAYLQYVLPGTPEDKIIDAVMIDDVCIYQSDISIAHGGAIISTFLWMESPKTHQLSFIERSGENANLVTLELSYAQKTPSIITITKEMKQVSGSGLILSHDRNGIVVSAPTGKSGVMPATDVSVKEMNHQALSDKDDVSQDASPATRPAPKRPARNKGRHSTSRPSTTMPAGTRAQ